MRLLKAGLPPGTIHDLRRALGAAGAAGTAAVVVAAAGHAAGAAQRVVPGDPAADGAARPRGDAGTHAMVAAAATHDRRDAGDPGAGAAGAGCGFDACRFRADTVGGGQRLGLGWRLAAPHAGGGYPAGPSRTRRAAG